MPSVLEENGIFVGSNHTGKVVAIEENKCIFEITGGSEAVCFISDVAIEYVDRIEDVIQIGDELAVKVVKIGRFRNINVSRKAYLKEQRSLASDHIYSMKISQDKIRTVIGSGGSRIHKIMQESNVQIDIESEGTVYIESENQMDISKAIKMIEDLTADYKIELGNTYLSKVISVMPFGCFVEIFPGKEALCHIANLSTERTKNVDDVVRIGDEILVKVIKINCKNGKIAVSRKAVLMEEICKDSPEIEMIKIESSKISNVIGAGGKKINQITEETGVVIDIESDGTIYLKSSNPEMRASAIEQINKILTSPSLQIGDVFDSKVVSVFDFGCFVELTYGIEALCHVSELDSARVENVSDFIEVGDTLRVQVIKVDEYSGKISVSRKVLLPVNEIGQISKVETIKINPEKIRAVIGAGGRQINKVTNETGVIVDIESSGTIYLKSPDMTMIEEAKSMINELCRDAKIGEVYAGKVVSIVGVGCFVELFPGTDGMCLKADLSHEEVERIEEVVSIGDVIDVQVTSIDEETGKVNVSRKALIPEPVKNVGNITCDSEEVPAAASEIKVGKIYTGTVVSIMKYGCFIELLPGTDGLCHISELDIDRVTRVEDIVNIGDKIKVKVTEIGESSRKISVSRIAVLRAEQLMNEPDLEVVKVNIDKLNDVFGVGGRNMNNIIAKTGVNAIVEKDGTIYLRSSNAEKISQAKHMIEELTRDFEVGMNFTGKVVKVSEFGAYIEIFPGKIGSCHITDLTTESVSDIDKVVSVGDELDVQIVRKDLKTGRIVLSHIAALK